jgi:tetratricopeptide (TPR) repeat protein
MESTSMRADPRNADFAGRIEWDAVVTWVLCFGLVAYLGIEGGGYDPLFHDQVGIGVWWVLLVGVLVGALPRLGPSRLAMIALGLFAAFVLWTALSLIWTESAERTSAELARLLTYLGVFSLVLFVRAPRESQRLVSAVAAAIVLIALLALLSRLHPDWFPSADQTARLLADSRERLSFPINYWNGLGALIAIGFPLVLQVSASAKSVVVRALAAAAMPAMALAIFFTLSRASIGGAVVAVAVFIAVTDDRTPKLLTLAVTGLGAGVLIALATEREAVHHGLTNSAAHSQGDELLLIGLLVCGAVALFHGLVSKVIVDGRRPGWTVPTRGQSLAALAALAVVLAIAGVAIDAPSRASSALDEFKGGGNAGTGTGRLNSFAGESRYALWKSAIDENETAPLIGTGAATFEYWWTRDAAGEEAVQDAHSLYLQTLGEVGLVGLALLAGFMAAILVAGSLIVVRSDSEQRSQLAAALAGCVGFFLVAAVDWTWQIPVLPVTMLLLASTLVMAPGALPGGLAFFRRLPLRLPLAAGGLVAIAAIAVPLASTSLVDSSESAVRSGDLTAALADARSAQNVQPGAATPRLQQALVLELQGNLPAAAAAARAARERESTNWRTWLVLSRIEAERGRAGAAVSAYREAKSLNPLSPLFDR